LKISSKNSGQRKSNRRRWLIAGLVVLALGVAVAVLGYLYFPKYNEERLVRRAGAFLAAKDFSSAAITAQRALQINDRSIAAVRTLTTIMDEARDPAALTWKQRLVELEPGSLENRLSLAETALALGQAKIADEALAGAREAGQGQARYHALAGRAARAAKNPARAETEFADAARLDATNEDYQLEWQWARLQSADAATRAAGRTSLEALLESPAVSARAARLLIREALQRGEAGRALTLAENLEKSGGAIFEDRLLHLDLLHRMKRPNYASSLTSLQEEAAQKPEQLATLIGWLNERHSALLVVDWSRRLPPAILTTMPVPVALAQSYVRLRDWDGLKPIISDKAVLLGQPQTAPGAATEGKWGDFEFLRLAFLAATHRADGDQQQAKVRWQAAVKATANRPAAVAMLARHAIEWKWEDDATEVLWQAARTSPEPMWALQFLYRTYEERQATAELLAVTTKVLEVEPGNRDMGNNHAMLSLLLGTKVAEAVEKARELHRLDPQNPNYVSTYALGLFLQGSPQEAVDLMKTLTPEQLQQPGFAAYYGLFLSATDAKEESRKFLELAREAKLLPEEKRLVAQAWERIGKAAPAPAAQIE
jgi:predicted Zn-dependent protease